VIRLQLALVAVWVCVQPLQAQVGSRLWRAEERVVLSDFSVVQALAVSEELLYAATTGGLAILDRRFGRWEPPVTGLDGYPPEPVRIALVDPVDRSVWLGTDQRLVHYLPTLRRFETIPVLGGVRDLMLDRRDPFAGMWVMTRTGWEFLPYGGIMLTPSPRMPTEPLRVMSVDAALARAPYLATRAAEILTDERLRRHHYTAAALAPDTEELFLGTDGMGLLQVDPGTTEVRRMPFGLLAPSASGVVAVPGGVWTGSPEGAQRSGFTFVADDLQRFAHDEGPRGVGYAFRRVFDVVWRDGSLWAATDGGVVRRDGEQPGELLYRYPGQERDVVFALAEQDGGVWAATQQGLVRIDRSGEARRVDSPGVGPLLAVVASGDTVWIGGLRGLGVTRVGGDTIYRPRSADVYPELRDRVVALALQGDTLFSATRARLLWRAPGEDWVVERPLGGDLGSITALLGDSGGVWVGGTNGLAFYRPGTRDFVLFNQPGDLPGMVRDIAADPTYLWVAATGGLVRFTKEALLR
jgi:ligand-binding sensor domain-containing protein